MEQPCYKCGQVLEEGRPFCPHCGAPQIRVLVVEPATAGAFAETPASGALPSSLPATETIPVLAVPMQWSHAFRACALAALIAFVLVLFSSFIGMLAAGFLAVTFYRRHSPAATLRPAEAAKLGALAGILCSCILSVAFAGVAMVPGARAKMQDEFTASIQRVATWLPANPADTRASIDQLKTPRGFATALIEVCIGIFLLSIVLGSLGGVLGGALLRRRDRS